MRVKVRVSAERRAHQPDNQHDEGVKQGLRQVAREHAVDGEAAEHGVNQQQQVFGGHQREGTQQAAFVVAGDGFQIAKRGHVFFLQADGVRPRGSGVFRRPLPIGGRYRLFWVFEAV